MPDNRGNHQKAPGTTGKLAAFYLVRAKAKESVNVVVGTVCILDVMFGILAWGFSGFG
jgi:hypothetical protein